MPLWQTTKYELTRHLLAPFEQGTFNVMGGGPFGHFFGLDPNLKPGHLKLIDEQMHISCSAEVERACPAILPERQQIRAVESTKLTTTKNHRCVHPVEAYVSVQDDQTPYEILVREADIKTTLKEGIETALRMVFKEMIDKHQSVLRAKGYNSRGKYATRMFSAFLQGV